MISTKPKFQIPSKYRHVINDTNDAEAKCADIWKEFEKNRYLQGLLKAKDNFKEFCEKGDKANKVPYEYYELIEKNWEIMLAYYALMDNQNSPFQQFKEDLSQKMRVVLDTLNISPIVAAIIDLVPEDSRVEEDAEIIICNCLTQQIRIPYMQAVCSNEWQNILDMQFIVYSSSLKLRIIDLNLKPEHVIRVESDKYDLIDRKEKKMLQLEDSLARLYGAGSRMITEAQRHLNIGTAFSEHALIKENITDIGQNRNDY
jgi:hypothetical protein